MENKVVTTLLCLVVTSWLMNLGIMWCLASPNKVAADDELSLLALKDRIKSQVLAHNWTQGSPFCSWIGVTCSRRHPLRVTALDLQSMDLQGSISEEIGNLSFLSYLDISNNSFSGTIPASIGNCGRLVLLDMAHNELSGQIPPTIGRLSKLVTLNMAANQLDGTIPTSLFNFSLPNLQSLDLSKNQLSETIPKNIFNISSLQLIYLYRNQLTGTLPDVEICHHLPKLQILSLHVNQLHGNMSASSLWSCRELEGLSLFSNNFTGTIPMNIGNLSRLEILYLNQNQLTGNIPTSIGNLSKLEELDLGENNINGRVPSQIHQLPNFRWLNVGVNKLHGELPASLYNISKLEAFSITQNEISGELPSSIAIGLPNLKQFFIGDNRFSGVIPSAIANLSHLIELDFGQNSFSGHIPVNLGNMHNLQWLSFGSNRFTNNLSVHYQDFLTPLANCKYINSILFYNNPKIIGELPESFFRSKNMSSTLNTFASFSCGISGKIPTEIKNLNNLVYLDISDNKMVGEIPDSFQKLSDLQRLELQDNMLQGSIPHSICNLVSLYYMSLSRNMLSGPLPICIGTDLTSLEELYLSENAFNSNIPFTLWNNKEIWKIHLGNNFLDGTLSQQIGHLNSIIELDISGNQLIGNIPDSIGQLQSLTLMSLSNNSLDGSIPDSLSNLKGLEYLDLSYNNLSGTIPKSLVSLEHLEYFNVSFNQLRGEIPNEGSFKNLTADCFIGNKDLCGSPRLNVKPCKIIHPKTSHNNRLILRNILPPVLVFIIFVAATTIFLIIRHRHRKSLDVSTLSVDTFQERISYYDILHATKNFDESTLIGRGSFGSVYKAEFSHGLTAAVKVFNLDNQGALKSFDDECQILRSIRHRNLVKVMTSCSNHDFKALVMEYMSNGNLDMWLHARKGSLNIFQRFGIMIDVAAALEYLHHGCSTPIVHCDLKPSNILLDNDMVAHVVDFGISKLLTGDEITQQTKTLGTIGYMAPEYGSGGFISTAADVYSYGIVLMETFTRKNPTDGVFSEELTIKKWVLQSFPDSLLQILDFELFNNMNENDVGDRYKRCLTSIIALALECTAEVPEERPSMIEVTGKIQKIKIDLR